MFKFKYFAVLGLVLVSGLIGWSLAKDKPPAQLEINWVESTGQYQEIQNQVKTGNVFVLDVRTKAEFDEMHAIGSILFDLEKLKNNQLPEIDKNSKVYVYCRSGNRSLEATKILKNRGYSDVTDLGGLENMFNLGAAFERTPIPEIDSISIPDSVKSNPIKGDLNSPIKLVEYIDYLCPYCQKFESEVAPTLISKYVDSGKMSIEFRNAAYKGADAVHIASATMCAHEQAQFWPYHNQLISAVSKEDDITETENLLKYANQISNLNQTQFKSCLLDAKYVELVRAQTKFASNQKVSGTPQFIINGRIVGGFLTIEQFSQIIDQEISN